MSLDEFDDAFAFVVANLVPHVSRDPADTWRPVIVSGAFMHDPYAVACAVVTWRMMCAETRDEVLEFARFIVALCDDAHLDVSPQAVMRFAATAPIPHEDGGS